MGDMPAWMTCMVIRMGDMVGLVALVAWVVY